MSRVDDCSLKASAAIFDEIGNHDRDFYGAGGGKGDIRIDRDQFTLIHGKVDFLSILQIL